MFWLLLSLNIEYGCLVAHMYESCSEKNTVHSPKLRGSYAEESLILVALLSCWIWLQLCSYDVKHTVSISNIMIFGAFFLAGWLSSSPWGRCIEFLSPKGKVGLTFPIYEILRFCPPDPCWISRIRTKISRIRTHFWWVLLTRICTLWWMRLLHQV